MLRDKRELILNWFVAEGQLTSGIVGGLNNPYVETEPAKEHLFRNRTKQNRWKQKALCLQRCRRSVPALLHFRSERCVR